MSLPRDLLVAVSLGLLCLLAWVVNRDQPLVRNSLVYAHAAEHVIEHGFDPRPVVADSRLSYDKPIAFAWVATPLVLLLGNHHGLMLASALGVVAMLAAALQLFRTVLPDPAAGRLRARALLFSLLSPLVVYQTWSAHPDAIETALQLSALTLAWRLCESPTVAPWRRALLLFACMEASVLFKNYGLVLLVALPLAFGRRWLLCWRRGERAAVLGVAAAWLGTALLAVLAWFGLHPLHRLAGEGGGAGQYGQGSWLESAGGTLLGLLLGLGLCVQFALPFAAAARPAAHRLGPLGAFAVVQVAGLLPFPHAYYNMRYFLPVLPVVGLCAALGVERLGRAAQTALVAVFVVAALATTAVFNVAPLHARAADWLPALLLRGPAMPGMLDNLRLPLHRQQADWLQRLNGTAAPGATVYLVDFDYYGDAQHGVYERGGRIRADLTTRYVARRDLHPTEPTFYVCFGRRPPRDLLAALGAVEEPAPGVFLVRRP